MLRHKWDGPKPIAGSLADRMQHKPVAQQLLLVVVIVIPIVFLSLIGLLGLLILLNPADQPQCVSFEELMNGALVTGLAVIGLPWLQRMAFWRMAAAGKERIARVRVNWPARLRFRHACFLLVGMATLLFAYAPYAHQQWIYITLSHWAAGNSSFTYLVHLVVIYLPMGALIAIAFALTGRDRVAARSHALAPEAAQITEAEFNWLSGFAMAFGILSFACWMLGYMIQRYLE